MFCKGQTLVHEWNCQRRNGHSWTVAKFGNEDKVPRKQRFFHALRGNESTLNKKGTNYPSNKESPKESFRPIFEVLFEILHYDKDTADRNRGFRVSL